MLAVGVDLDLAPPVDDAKPAEAAADTALRASRTRIPQHKYISGTELLCAETASLLRTRTHQRTFASRKHSDQ